MVMSWLSAISPFQLIIISSLLSVLICDDRDADELNVVGNLIVAVGALVMVFAAQQQFIKASQDTASENKSK